MHPPNILVLKEKMYKDHFARLFHLLAPLYIYKNHLHWAWYIYHNLQIVGHDNLETHHLHHKKPPPENIINHYINLDYLPHKNEVYSSCYKKQQ